jgi:hypothetical protein
MTTPPSMVERAARAMLESDQLEGFKPDTLETYKVASRAALLAALDPEDEALVREIARWITYFAPFNSINGYQARDCATRMLDEWRKAIAQTGGTGDTTP